MSSHHSTIVVPEDVSHLHSHTSGPTNLHSIRLVLPKHPFDHDTAWVKQLQPRQHSSNKYLSFGSLGCRATATRMWISHFARPAGLLRARRGLLGQSSNAVSALARFWAQLTFCFLFWLHDPGQGTLIMCVGQGALFFLSTSWKLWLSLS